MTYNSPSVQYIGMLHIYQMLDSFIYEEKIIPATEAERTDVLM